MPRQSGQTQVVSKPAGVYPPLNRSDAIPNPDTAYTQISVYPLFTYPGNLYIDFANSFDDRTWHYPESRAEHSSQTERSQPERCCRLFVAGWESTLATLTPFPIRSFNDCLSAHRRAHLQSIGRAA
jgi:hypothetical protein